MTGDPGEVNNAASYSCSQQDDEVVSVELQLAARIEELPSPADIMSPGCLAGFS